MRMGRTAVMISSLLLLLPASMFAANAAMLNTSGHASVNGTESPATTALFAGDIVTTQPNSAATIDAKGSMVLVLASSQVQFQGDSLHLEHGQVLVTTSQRMAVRAGHITITPANERPARFTVAESAGKVVIAARMGNLMLDDGRTTTMLSPGQNTERTDPDPSGNEKKKASADPPANGNSLSTKTAILLDAGISGGITAIVLGTASSPHCPPGHGGNGHDCRPISPAKP